MVKVIFFANDNDARCRPIAERLHDAGIEFRAVPTSGQLILDVGGLVAIGPTMIGRAIAELEACR